MLIRSGSFLGISSIWVIALWNFMGKKLFIAVWRKTKSRRQKWKGTGWVTLSLSSARVTTVGPGAFAVGRLLPLCHHMHLVLPLMPWNKIFKQAYLSPWITFLLICEICLLKIQKNIYISDWLFPESQLDVIKIWRTFLLKSWLSWVIHVRDHPVAGLSGFHEPSEIKGNEGVCFLVSCHTLLFRVSTCLMPREML